MNDLLTGRPCQLPPRLCKSIDAQALAQLGKHSHFRGRRFDLTFELQGDVLVIRGRLPSFYLKQLVQTVLREIACVRHIENRVTVISVTL